MLKRSVDAASFNSDIAFESYTAQNKGNNCLQDSLIQFYKAGSYTDVLIKVKWREEIKEFHTHKIVLAMRSPVFAKEFRNKEFSSFITFVVEGVNPQLIGKLLWYFYTDDLIVESPKQIIGFAKLAKYYQVKSVNLLCKHRLSLYTIEEGNVWSLLDAALFFKMQQLRHSCIQFIRKDLKGILLSPEFLSISQETLATFETEFSHDLTRNESMEAVLRWLQCNKQANRSILLKYDFASLTINGFLDILESFPSFLSAKDALGILANKLRPSVMDLPKWYESIPTAEASDASVSAAMIAERSLRLEPPFNKQLFKSSLFGTSGFKCTVTIQLKLAYEFSQHLNVIMFELAFGSRFVPENNLKIKLFSYQYGIRSIRKKRQKILLHSTPDNYYIISRENYNLDKVVPVIFEFQVEATQLKRWRDTEPLPNNRYRVVQIPQSNTYSTSLSVGQTEAVSLTTLSDWFAFVDPTKGTKQFVFTALYFDRE